MSPSLSTLWRKALDVAVQHGFMLPHTPKSIGNWHRVPDINKAASNRSAAYKCCENCVVMVGHASGFSCTVFPENGCDNSARIDEKRIRLLAEEQQRQNAERFANNQRIARKAQSIWSHAIRSGTHPYVKSKGLNGLHNARIEQASGLLLIPMWVYPLELVNLQRISDDGRRKRPLKGGRVKGAFSPIGRLHEAKCVLLTEGWATGATVKELYGMPTVVALSAGNLVNVAETVRELLPEAEIIVAGDDDRHEPRNPGRSAAVAAAKLVGGKVLLPTLCKDCPCTDHNDAMVCARRAGR